MAWLLGTVLQLQQADTWPMTQTLGAGLIALLCLVGGLYALQNKRVRQSHLRLRTLLHMCICLCVCVGFTLLALVYVNGRCWIQSQDALDLAFEEQDLQVAVEVASLPHFSDRGVKFLGQVIRAQTSGSKQTVRVPHRLELSWSDWEAPTSMDLPIWQSIRPGDRWLFQVRLKRPHGSMNPGGLDEELRLWEQGVMATGNIRVGKQALVPQKLASTWHQPVDQLRHWVRSQVAQTFRFSDARESTSAGVIAALVMGDQAAIASADWQTFRVTGVAHLMSISGLHITMFAWLTAWLIAKICRQSALLGSNFCLTWPAPVVAMLGGAVCATLYAVFCGWGLPAQRTILMLWVMALLKWRGLHWPWYWVWALSLWVVLVWDPWSLLQASFWLSFVAVGALILADVGASARRTKLVYQDPMLVQSEADSNLRLILVTRLVQGLRSLAREQGVVTLALFPLSVLFFGQVSLTGLVANLIAIPWVTFCVTPLAMLGLAWHPFWQFALAALEPLMSMLQWLASWSGGSVSFAQAPLGLMVLAVFGALLSLQIWPWGLRVWGLMWMLPVLFWQSRSPNEGHFEIWALDIGQGNAVVIRTAHHVLLYDTGPAWGDGADAGQRVLVPFLARMGLKLDRLILSHRDADHTGGAASVMAAQPQADLWSSIESGHPLAQGRELHRCVAGQRWEWDGVQFEMLHPHAASYAKAKTSNELSCVLRIDAGQGQKFNLKHDQQGASALLVGDIEALQEASLVQANLLKRVDFLLVPHHGSQTSSTLQFVQTVKPRWAMVQAGYRNRYGHPAPQVIARYAQMKVPVQVSPTCGAAHWQSATPDRLDCEREVRRRYWQFKGP
jgi:competence protein ComEC